MEKKELTAKNQGIDMWHLGAFALTFFLGQHFITPIFTGNPPAPIWLNVLFGILGGVGFQYGLKVWEKRKENLAQGEE